MIYAALMFDIIESRNYLDRYDAQYFVIENIHYLNYVYAEHIKKEVVPSAGDEFQGLFYDMQSAFLYARKLQLLIYPIKIRVGIGYGQIKYDVNEWDSSAFDGEAYYLARDAINEMRKANGEPSLTEEELPTATEDEEWDSEWCRCDFLFASGDWLNYHKENDEVLLCIEPDFVFELYPQMDLREDPKYTYVQPGYEIQDIYVEWKIYFWHGGLTDNYLTITLGREDIARLRDYLKLVIKR